MTNTAKHSPAPWMVYDYIANVGKYNKAIDIGANNRALARVIGEFDKEEPGNVAKANAAFIVKAVNYHYELLELLKQCSPYLEKLISPKAIELEHKVRAIIAKAEGK